MAERPTLDEMIHCAAHELGYREEVYPRRVAARVMTQDLADREIMRMKAILELLKLLQEAARVVAEWQREGR